MATNNITVNFTVKNAVQVADVMEAIAVSNAKIAAHYEDIAEQMRCLAHMGDKDVVGTEDTQATEGTGTQGQTDKAP